MGKVEKKEKKENSQGFFGRMIDKLVAAYNYCIDGVWSDPRNTLGVRSIKTVNLTLSAFFNSTLQTRSMSLTYSTVLAIVPAFAVLVAIGRGFGFQDLLQNQLFQMFPAQHKVIETALTFVDSYLKSTTQGIFVGVGLVVLLWTIISLLSSIEDTFNTIWGVRVQRTIMQKITDYIAICLMVPVLLICSSGLSIFMSSTIQDNLHLPFLTPIVNVAFEVAPIVLVWLAFTLSYYLIPNTKVKFKYAAIAGALAAVAFQIIQLLFLNGQLYVSKYNAIYGSFAFLPLMLIWLQLSWLVLLTGCMIAYSMQNVFTFNLMGDESQISNRGWHNIALIVMAIVAKRFVAKEKPLTEQEIAVEYYLPIRIVNRLIEKLQKAKLIFIVEGDDNRKGITPAVETENFTVEEFLKAFDSIGVTDFMTGFNKVYGNLMSQLAEDYDLAYAQFKNLIVKDLNIPTPAEIKEKMISVIRETEKEK